MIARRFGSGTRVARLLTLTLVVAIGTVAVACNDSRSDAQKKAPDTSAASDAPGTATIDSLVVPPTVDCAKGDTSTEVSIEYAVSGAAHQEVRVDGLPAEGTDNPKGTVTVGVRCDPLPHDVVVVAYDSNDHRTAEQKQFTVNTVG